MGRRVTLLRTVHFLASPAVIGVMASSPHLNSDWMSMLCPQLWDLPLHHLSIPGSRDTMTYCLSRKSPISHSESRLLQVLGKVLPCVTLPMVLRWSITQVQQPL